MFSKSRFLSSTQCSQRLWRDFHAPHLAEEASDVLLALFEVGYELVELVCTRYSGSYLIGQDQSH